MQKKLKGAIGERVLNQGLEAQYKEMAKDEAREAEALEWSEATIGDVIAKLNEVYKDAAPYLDNDLLNTQAASLPKEEW